MHKAMAATAGESSGHQAARDGRGGQDSGTEDSLRRMVMENPVTVLGLRDCCMCHVVVRLLQGLGVNPTVYKVVEEEQANLMADLSTMIGDHDTKGRKNNDNSSSSNNVIQFPVVFVGGKLFGGLERLMATHISDELVPVLREAGALWL